MNTKKGNIYARSSSLLNGSSKLNKLEDMLLSRYIEELLKDRDELQRKLNKLHCARVGDGHEL